MAAGFQDFWGNLSVAHLGIYVRGYLYDAHLWRSSSCTYPQSFLGFKTPVARRQAFIYQYAHIKAGARRVNSTTRFEASISCKFLRSTPNALIPSFPTHRGIFNDLLNIWDPVADPAHLAGPQGPPLTSGGHCETFRLYIRCCESYMPIGMYDQPIGRSFFKQSANDHAMPMNAD